MNTRISFIFILFLLLFSCKGNQNSKDDSSMSEGPDVVNVITLAMEFQMPDTIPSGWNTFKYENKSTQTHFLLIDKYPEGKTIDSMRTLVVPVFDSGMKLSNEGKSEEGLAEFGKLPSWFSQVVFMGGTGLISPRTTCETTLKMDPGYYIAECYVKMENGVFHTSMGMSKVLFVASENSGNEEPVADVAIQISSTDGIVFNNAIPGGPTTFSVEYLDQIVHENFVGHDISLAKIDSQADIEGLNQWMDWSNPKGLIEPAPGGVTFMGGVNDMPIGSKAYFTVDLKPGDYVLISEVPDPQRKNMLKRFSINN